MLSLLLVFLRLGLTSFGGPAAHLGYFRKAFVEQRRWFDDAAYGRLIALCQFLPGPASSQAAFAIGLERRGLAGGLTAWGAFTLPSVCLMTAAAFGLGDLQGPLAAGALHGLKLAAVAVVADAVLNMARTLAPDWRRASISVAALALATVFGSGWAQLAAIAVGLACGPSWLRRSSPAAGGDETDRRVSGVIALAIFALLLVLGFLPGLGVRSAASEAAAFYRSGALVFGGGHVVLPLLERAVVAPGWVPQDAFLSGYGLAQALPGPLFSFAAYLGALSQAGPGGVVGAMLAMAAISTPGLLAVYGALPFWRGLAGRPWAAGAVAGANAAVVGLLAAALYDPVWTSAVRAPADFALAAAGWVALVAWRWPPLAVVAILAVAGGAGTGLRW